MNGRTILVIDDDVELLRQMTAALAAAGFQVQAATDGEVGMRRMAEAPADLVITDILMPRREGLETICALRRQRPELKILAISGGLRTDPGEFLGVARMLGADETLAKPFRLAQLAAVAARLLAAAAAEETAA